MKNNSYWEDRALLRDKLLEKDQKKIEKNLKKEYKEAIKEMKKEIAVLEAEGQLTEWQEYRLNEVIAGIESNLNSLANREQEILTNGLTDCYTNAYEFEKTSLGISFNQVDNSLIKEVLKTNWSGLTFSERIWARRDKLALKLKETLKAGLIRGDSLQDMARTLADEMNKSYKNAMTLVHTETCWIQSQATLQTYKEDNLEEYEFMAFLDERTTKECRAMNGKRFKLSEAIPGVNMPPLHCRCRSCIVPVIKD